MLGFMKSTIAAAALTTSATLFFSNVVLADDSEFELDPRLHQSFWGFAYTPENSAYYPNCGDTIEQVVRDMQLMSQLTTRVRLYGSDCQQLELVMEAIKLTKTNLHIFPGIFIDGNETTYERQRDTTFEVLDKYGVEGVLGITVGNEYILQQFTEDPAQRAEAEALVISKIADVKEILASKGYSKEIPVGTADAGSQITEELAAAADYIMANTHPFFSGINIEGAAEWTNQFLINDEPRFATEAGKTLYNAEIGWPTNADAGGELSFNGSAASIENLQILLDSFVCQANEANEFGYFYFELFDAEWKRRFLGAEPYWGLFDSSAERVLKEGITIPDCPAQGEPLLAGANEVPGSGGGENTETGGGGSNNGGSGNGNGNGNGGSFGVKEHSVQWGVGALVGGLVMLGGFAMF